MSSMNWSINPSDPQTINVEIVGLPDGSYEPQLEYGDASPLVYGEVGTTASHTYPVPGTFKVSLIARGITGISEIVDVIQVVVRSAEATAVRPAPVLTSIDPNTAQVGAAQLVMTLTGENFEMGCKVFFDNVESATSFISDTSLSVVVDPMTT